MEQSSNFKTTLRLKRSMQLIFYAHSSILILILSFACIFQEIDEQLHL